jgi:hypothetical protein
VSRGRKRTDASRTEDAKRRRGERFLLDGRRLVDPVSATVAVGLLPLLVLLASIPRPRP